MSIVFQSGHVEDCKVDVFKLWEYSIEQLVAEKLYMFLPLTVFSLRRELDKATKKKDEASTLLALEKIKEATNRVAAVASDLLASKDLELQDEVHIIHALKYFFHYLNDRYFGNSRMNKEVDVMLKTWYETDARPKLEQKDKIIAQKDKELEQKDKTIAQKDKTIADQMAEILRLKKALGEA
jgi:hypothetical protein